MWNHRRKSGTLLLTVVIFISLFSSAFGAQPCADKDTGSTVFTLNPFAENTEVGTIVGKLNIKGDSTQIQLSVPQPNDYLSFDTSSREVKIVKEIDADTLGSNSTTFRISCRDKVVGLRIDLTVEAEVQDINDNAPIFEKTNYTLNLPELTRVGSTVLKVSATDTDKRQQAISYKIQDGPFSSYFSIPVPASGEIELAQHLDFEKFATMSLKVLAIDSQLQSNEKLTSTVDLVVIVLDEDDNDPVFKDEIYTATVAQNALVDTKITVSPPISATDGDKGLNVAINYKLEDFDGSGQFKIDKTTAEITLAKAGLKAGKQNMNIVAYQIDNEAKKTTARLTITVQSSTENPPVFDPNTYSLAILENTAVGSTLTTLKAKDEDQGDVLKFSLVAASDFFDVDTNSGDLTLKKALDYETQKSYTIKVSVTDGKTTPATAEVTIAVVNVNDQNPEFVKPSYKFEIERKKDGKVGQVTATDLDVGSKVQYSLVSYTDLFRIDSNGNIWMTADTDKMAAAAYSLTILATDGDTSPRTGTVNVDVLFPEAAILGASVGGGEIDLLPLIVVIVICVLLLIIIIALVIYINRRHIHICWRDKIHVSVPRFELKR